MGAQADGPQPQRQGAGQGVGAGCRLREGVPEAGRLACRLPTPRALWPRVQACGNPRLPLHRPIIIPAFRLSHLQERKKELARRLGRTINLDGAYEDVSAASLLFPVCSLPLLACCALLVHCAHCVVSLLEHSTAVMGRCREAASVASCHRWARPAAACQLVATSTAGWLPRLALPGGLG